MTGISWNSAAGAVVVLLASFAATLPAHAEADLVYGGLADGAGVPISRPNSTDPGALPGGAALAAQSQRFDSQRVFGGLNLGALAIEAAQRRPFGDASKAADEALSL